MEISSYTKYAHSMTIKTLLFAPYMEISTQNMCTDSFSNKFFLKIKSLKKKKKKKMYIAWPIDH